MWFNARFPPISMPNKTFSSFQLILTKLSSKNYSNGTLKSELKIKDIKWFHGNLRFIVLKVVKISKLWSFMIKNDFIVYCRYLLIKNNYTYFYTFLMCQVIGCKANHQSHFCRVCQNSNVNHFSRNCPKGTVIYHGTSK